MKVVISTSITPYNRLTYIKPEAAIFSIYQNWEFARRTDTGNGVTLNGVQLVNPVYQEGSEQFVIDQMILQSQVVRAHLNGTELKIENDSEFELTIHSFLNPKVIEFEGKAVYAVQTKISIQK